MIQLHRDTSRDAGTTVIVVAWLTVAKIWDLGTHQQIDRILPVRINSCHVEETEWNLILLDKIGHIRKMDITHSLSGVKSSQIYVF